MFGKPHSSPWGAIQHCEALCPGIFEVDTAGHGGVMVHERYAAGILSPEARSCGWRTHGYLCYEEDCDAAIVKRELMDKRLWEPSHAKDKAAYSKVLDESLQHWNPEYWWAREKSAATFAEKGEKTAPSRAKTDMAI